MIGNKYTKKTGSRTENLKIKIKPERSEPVPNLTS